MRLSNSVSDGRMSVGISGECAHRGRTIEVSNVLLTIGGATVRTLWDGAAVQAVPRICRSFARGYVCLMPRSPSSGMPQATRRFAAGRALSASSSAPTGTRSCFWSRSLSFAEVGHSECLHVAEFLELGCEVERVACDVVEDVEATAEEDLPASIGDNRAVVDRVVERDIEVDAPDCRTLLDLQEVFELLAQLLSSPVFSVVMRLTLTSSAASLALVIPPMSPMRLRAEWN